MHHPKYYINVEHERNIIGNGCNTPVHLICFSGQGEYIIEYININIFLPQNKKTKNGRRARHFLTWDKITFQRMTFLRLYVIYSTSVSTRSLSYRINFQRTKYTTVNLFNFCILMAIYCVVRNPIFWDGVWAKPNQSNTRHEWNNKWMMSVN